MIGAYCSEADINRLPPSSGRRSKFSGNFHAVSFYWEKYILKNPKSLLSTYI